VVVVASAFFRGADHMMMLLIPSWLRIKTKPKATGMLAGFLPVDRDFKRRPNSVTSTDRAVPGTGIQKLSVPGYGIDRDPLQNQNKIARSKAGNKAFP